MNLMKTADQISGQVVVIKALALQIVKMASVNDSRIHRDKVFNILAETVEQLSSVLEHLEGKYK